MPRTAVVVNSYNTIMICEEIERSDSMCSRTGQSCISGTGSALDERLEQCRTRGKAFLTPLNMKPPQNAYWESDEFRTLAAGCAEGDAVSMEEMGDYFAQKAAEEPKEAFYDCAELFWRTRAYLLHRSERGRAYLAQRVEAAPGMPLYVPAVTEKLRGSGEGRVLNALGFMFFEPHRTYNLKGLDAQGVVEVSSDGGSDGPDESGFGMEEYCCWWALDDCLNLPEGAGCIHETSRWRYHTDSGKRKYRAMHDAAAAQCRTIRRTAPG